MLERGVLPQADRQGSGCPSTMHLSCTTQSRLRPSRQCGTNYRKDPIQRRIRSSGRAELAYPYRHVEHPPFACYRSLPAMASPVAPVTGDRGARTGQLT